MVRGDGIDFDKLYFHEDGNLLETRHSYRFRILLGEVMEREVLPHIDCDDGVGLGSSSCTPSAKIKKLGRMTATVKKIPAKKSLPIMIFGHSDRIYAGFPELPWAAFIPDHDLQTSVPCLLACH